MSGSQNAAEARLAALQRTDAFTGSLNPHFLCLPSISGAAWPFPGPWASSLPLRTSRDSVLTGNRFTTVSLLAEIFDWGKLQYDPFLLQIYRQSMVRCQLYQEDPNLFCPYASRKD